MPSPPSPTATATPVACSGTPSAYARAVVESWLPACSLAQNIYNDPQAALGPPDAAGSGPVSYSGFISLGFGGHVTLDLGGCINDRPGADLRVFQAVSSEPVTVYVSTRTRRALHARGGLEGLRQPLPRHPGLLRVRPRYGRRDAGALRARRGRRALPLPRRHEDRRRRPRRGPGAGRRRPRAREREEPGRR